MWQRIQTVYLALAVLLCVACLCLPIGSFVAKDGDVVATLFNLWASLPAPITVGADSSQLVLASAAETSHLFTPWALFALLLLTTSALAFSIFLFQKRLVQSRMVMLCCILLVGWYAIFAAFAYLLSERFEASFMPTPWASFPAIACILSYLAFRGILKDEMLVRSLDRLR